MLALDGNFDILLIYSVKEILSYEEIYNAVGQIIENLNDRFAQKQVVSEVPVKDEGETE